MINSISKRMLLLCLFVVSPVMLVEHAAYGMKRKFEKVEEDNDKQNDDKNKKNKTDESVEEETREAEEKQVATKTKPVMTKQEKKKKFLEQIENIFLAKGDKTKAALILKKYPNLLTLKFGEDKRTLLMGVVMRGHKEVVQLFLERGADVNTADRYGKTALMFAADEGHKDIVKLLLDAGANVNAVNIDGQTALMYCITAHMYCIENRGITQSGIDIIKLICSDKNHDIDKKDDRADTESRRSALSYAIEEGSYEVVELLIKHKASVDQLCNGSTGLMDACKLGYEKIVHILLKNKASLHLISTEDIEWGSGDFLPEGSNALHFAVIGNQKDIVKLLLRVFKSGQKIKNGPNQTGETPYELAVSEGYTEIVKLMDNPKSHLPVSKKEVEEHNILALRGSDFIDEVDDWEFDKEKKDLIKKDKKKLVNHFAHKPATYKKDFDLGFNYL